MQMLNTPLATNPRLPPNLPRKVEPALPRAEGLAFLFSGRALRGQRSHVCWFHSVNMGAYTENSSSFIPNQ
uniref:Uncharacterized protein n=1 Tax=blood disease bacterium R229 TaxID=741978 RepID=G2ZUM6_9RALS|nr:conserved hypothetical protein [blood disease bacterium R229]